MEFREEILPINVLPKELSKNGDIIGYYYPEGYLTRSGILFKRMAFYRPAIYRSAYVLSQINETATVDDVFEYIRSFSFQGFSFNDKAFIEQAFSKACEDADNGIKKYYNNANYKFYDWVSKEDRKIAIAKNSRNVKHHKIVDEIEVAINTLMEDGEFVHSGSIKEIASKDIKMSSKTIRGVISAFHRSRIDKYNEGLFGNKDYYAYLKASNEHKIETAVFEKQTLNKRKLGAATKLHYNTISNLWKKEWEGKILR